MIRNILLVLTREVLEIEGCKCVVRFPMAGLENLIHRENPIESFGSSKSSDIKNDSRMGDTDMELLGVKAHVHVAVLE